MLGHSSGCLVAQDPGVFYLDGERAAGLTEDDIKSLGDIGGQQIGVILNVRQYMIDGSRVDPGHPATAHVRQNDLESVGFQDLKGGPFFASAPTEVTITVTEKDDLRFSSRLTRSLQVFSR